jgi:hypothetical protein
MLYWVRGFPICHRTHSPLTPVASYAGPPSSLQTIAKCSVLLSGAPSGSCICLVHKVVMPKRQEIPISSIVVEMDRLSARHLNY